jgi:hypothetical protein
MNILRNNNATSNNSSNDNCNFNTSSSKKNMSLYSNSLKNITKNNNSSEQQDNSVLFIIDDFLKDFVYDDNSGGNIKESSHDYVFKKFDSLNNSLQSLQKSSSGSIFDMPLDDEKQLINSCKNDSLSFNISIVGLNNKTCKIVNTSIINITTSNITENHKCNETSKNITKNVIPPITRKNKTDDSPTSKECHDKNKIIKETKKEIVSMIKDDNKIKKLLLLYYLKRKRNKLNKQCDPPLFKQSEITK